MKHIGKFINFNIYEFQGTPKNPYLKSCVSKEVLFIVKCDVYCYIWEIINVYLGLKVCF